MVVLLPGGGGGAVAVPLQEHVVPVLVDVGGGGVGGWNVAVVVALVQHARYLVLLVADLRTGLLAPCLGHPEDDCCLIHYLKHLDHVS